MMTTSWMEVLTPSAPFYSNSDWLFGQQRGGGGTWTREENTRFEDALAKFDRDTPERWQQVAAMIPGKTVADVMSHYRELLDDVTEIEAGRVPCSAYGPSAFTLDWDGGYDFDGLKHSSYYGAGKRSGGRAVDQERKKGVPWTEDEHKRFLLGLRKYGKGDWRSISRNFVITRTPTQVASHAQKYFIRLNSGGKDKRRSSIHDITTANLQDNKPLLPTSQPSTSISQSGLATTSTSSSQFAPAIANSNKSSVVAIMFDAPVQEILMPEEFGICPYRMKLQAQNPCNGINLADTLVQEHHLLFPNAIGSSNH